MAIKKYFVVVDNFGTTRWYKDAKCKILHRENGPAVDCTYGHKEWWQNGQRHRIDGPAIERGQRGSKAWYINDVRLTEDEFNQAVKHYV